MHQSQPNKSADWQQPCCLPIAQPAWLYWLDHCPSTNTWAIAHLSHLKHGAVIFTQRQTAGRGQQGRTWYAPPGVLTVSIVLHQIPVQHLPSLSLVAGLAVIYAIEDLAPELQETLRLKWPNDVLANRQKLAGILCESVVSNPASGSVVVGIGLNRCVDFSQPPLEPQLNKIATSLHQLTPSVPDELSLMQRLRHYLLQTAGLMRWQRTAAEALPTTETQTNSGFTNSGFIAPGFTALLPALRQRDALLGQPLTVECPGESISGYGAGISDRGYLLLQLPNGTQRSIGSGHILINSPE